VAYVLKGDFNFDASVLSNDRIEKEYYHQFHLDILKSARNNKNNQIFRP
jgi:hypothetical protein